MSASKFPNNQNAKLVDENGLPIDATNPLDTTLKGTDNRVKLVDNAGALISSSNGLNTVVNNDIKFDYTQNAVKLMDNANTLISSTNPLDTTLNGTDNKVKLVDNAGTLISNSNGLNTVVNNDIKFDYTQNAVKLMDNAGTLISNSNGLNTVVNNDIKFDYTQNAVKLMDNANTLISSTNPLDVTGNVGITGTPNVNISNVPSVAISGTPTVNANITNGQIEIINDLGNAIPTTITNSPSVIVSGTPNVNVSTMPTTNVKTTGADTVAVTGSVNIGTMPPITVSDVGLKTTANTIKIDQATAHANHVEIVDSGGFPNSASNPLYTSTVLKDGANQAAIDANGVLSVKFPLTQNVNVSNSPTVSIQQSIAGANHVEIVNASGSANSAVEPLFTSTQITNTPNVNISNASVNVSASSNLPVQGTVAISTINGVAPAIDTSGNLSVKIAGTGNTVGLSTSANEIKIDQATPNANHVEIVNSAGSVNSAANPLYTSTQITNTPNVNISNDVYTIPETRYDMTQTGNSQTFWYSDFTLLNATSQTLILGITGFKIRVDKVVGTIDPSLTSTAYGKSFQLRVGSSPLCNLVTQSAGTVGLAEQFVFEPPAGGLFLQTTQSLSLYNEDTAASGTGSNFRVTVFGAFV